MEPTADHQVRLAAFRWLREQIDLRGDDVLPWSLLLHGFEHNGRRVPLFRHRPASIG